MKKIEIEKIIAYIAIIIGVGVVSELGGHLDLTQLLSVVVFSSFLAGSLFYWPFRNAFALVGLTVLVLLKVLDVQHLIEFAQLNIILFLVGMMTIIAFLEEKKFFDWFVGKLLKPFYNRPTVMVCVILLLGTVMAALVDEVTSILFMTVIMVKILKCYNVDGKKVLPFVMFLVFTTNIGSSALPIGNPVGVLVAFQAGFTIVDFMRWTLPIAIVASLVTTGIALLYLRRVAALNKLCPTSEVLEEVKANRDIKMAGGVFIFVIAGLILHSVIEQALGLAPDTMLLGFPLLVAGIVLFISRSNAQALVAKVDWWTLLYFMLLFASVGTLAYTGVTSTLATIISHSASGLFGTMLVLGLAICFMTSFMDNVLAVATFAPVVQSLAGTGIPIQPIWWIMLIGGTYFGNATIIGSTANIVAAGYLEKKGLGSFSQLGWIKIGVLVSAITFTIAFALLYIQYI